MKTLSKERAWSWSSLSCYLSFLIFLPLPSSQPPPPPLSLPLFYLSMLSSPLLPPSCWSLWKWSSFSWQPLGQLSAPSVRLLGGFLQLAAIIFVRHFSLSRSGLFFFIFRTESISLFNNVEASTSLETEKSMKRKHVVVQLLIHFSILALHRDHNMVQTVRTLSYVALRHQFTSLRSRVDQNSKKGETNWRSPHELHWGTDLHM